MNTWLGREPVESRKQVSLSEDALEAFQALKQACMSSLILAFANYTKDFLLKTDASKEGLGAVLSQKKQTSFITWLPMAAGPSEPMKRTIIPPNSNSWC